MAPASQDPEWFRYMSTLKEAGYGDVQLRPGGHGLENQLTAAMAWVKSGYMIVMCDTVRDVMEKRTRRDGTESIEPIAQGSLVGLWCHAHDLMLATGARAWSLSSCHRPDFMCENRISRRLGFLDGNLMGMLIPEDWKKFRVQQGHGMIYHVELSAAMWSRGHRFVRYMGLCVDHPYRRPGGQASVFTNPAKRRRLENAAIKKAAKMYPECLEYFVKPKASLNNMQYRFKTTAEPPLTMRRAMIRGRRRKHTALRASTSAVRMRFFRKEQEKRERKRARK